MSPIFEPLREQEKTAKDIGGKLEARTTRNHTGALQKEKKNCIPKRKNKAQLLCQSGNDCFGKVSIPN